MRAAPLLFGYRASPPVDVHAIEELLLRVARLVDELPTVTGPATPPGGQLLSLELNPVMVGTAGVRVLSVQADWALRCREETWVRAGSGDRGGPRPADGSARGCARSLGAVACVPAEVGSPQRP